MKNHSNSKTGSRSKVDNLTLVNSPTTNPPNIGEASMSWIQLVTHHWKNQVRSPEVSIHWSENFKFMIFGISNQYSHELDAGHVSHDLVLGLGNIFQLGVWENRVHHTVPLKSLIPIMYTALRPKMCSFLDEGLRGASPVLRWLSCTAMSPSTRFGLVVVFDGTKAPRWGGLKPPELVKHARIAVTTAHSVALMLLTVK